MPRGKPIAAEPDRSLPHRPATGAPMMLGEKSNAAMATVKARKRIRVSHNENAVEIVASR